MQSIIESDEKQPNVIIVGSTDYKTSMYYKKLGIPPSSLVTNQNHQIAIGHTSVGDIPDLEELTIVLQQADEVYWAESDISEFSDDQSYYYFLNWLKDFNLKYRKVKNLHSIKFDVYNWNRLGPITLTDNQAVFFGCSITAGTGLPDVETHYASLVAKHFKKDMCNLAVAGGSNSEIFDRFTQVDLVPGQIVVVQLTQPSRLLYCSEDKQLHRLMFADTSNPQVSYEMLTVYNKDFLFYETYHKIRAMVTIARAKQCKLVFWLINYKEEMIYSQLDQLYFYNMPEFVPASWLQNLSVDKATDNLHPGINSNKFIADTLITYIETVYGKI